MTLSSGSTPTVLSTGVPSVINTNASAVQSNASRFTISNAGRTTYNAKKSINVSMSLSLTYRLVTAANTNLIFNFYKNGVRLVGSEQNKSVSNTESKEVILIFETILIQNDFIDIYIENISFHRS